MSTLGDLIIEHGPYITGGAMPFPLAPNGHPIITADEINALRDELIELRQIRANVLAMATEYERVPRPIASGAIGRMLREWCE